ncbi:MAG: sialate O-acetylesterase [Bacteroidota bacterium]
MTRQLFWISCLFFISPFLLKAELQLSELIGDHMVMQRNQPVALWGWAKTGAVIQLQFQEQNYEAKALGEEGKWMFELPPMPAGGPYEMKISGDGATIVVKDIWLGDVWICSGQSNMEWTVINSQDAKSEMATATDGNIRHFKIPKSSSYEKKDHLAVANWEVCTPATVGDFTAVGYYFARALRKEHDVAIGLINTSWGGSRIEAWMSHESLGYESPEILIQELKDKKAEAEAEIKALFKDRLGIVPTEDLGWQEGKALWAAKDFDDRDWSEMTLPGVWESQGLDRLDGIVWFRRSIQLSEEQAKNGLRLHLGSIDDSDQTWINGQMVGRTDMAWNKQRIYEVDGQYLSAGENIIAVRVEDTGQGGGFHGDPRLLFYQIANEKWPLHGPWKYRVGKVSMMADAGAHHTPTLLYNKMIHPILDYPVCGTIWYQGESNTGKGDDFQYRELFPKMIEDWRTAWKCGPFPFLFVQLANFGQVQDQPGYSGWAVLRESQSKTLALKNTAQAVIIDIGEADDIHPRNKQDVGERLALAARHLAYGETISYSGPVYQSMTVEEGQIRLQFNHFGEGLLAKDRYAYLRGFSIAGADRQFVWAKARIEGDEVIVWNENVSNPVAVRYAWEENPEDSNLYNKKGLPASPFRTDDWKE